MQRRDAILLVSGIAVSACDPGTVAPKPYGLVDPDALLATCPGPPRRVKPGEPSATPPEALGYQASGDLLVATAVIPKRTPTPLHEYDAALSVVLMVAPTVVRAAEVYRSQSRQDHTFFNRTNAEPISFTPPLGATEVSAWATSAPASQVVVLARYQNYVIRFVGGISSDGIFPTRSDFLSSVRAADLHVTHALNGAA